jgi:hypothetical protein
MAMAMSSLLPREPLPPRLWFGLLVAFLIELAAFIVVLIAIERCGC